MRPKQMATKKKLFEIDLVTQAMQREAHIAVQEALLQHKLLGHTVVYARDRKPVEVPPWDIEIDATVLDPEKQEMARRAEIMWADKRRA